MAAYHSVEVSLNTTAVEVGVPSPQTVTVTLPNIGPQGPQGPAGASQADVLTVQGDLLYRAASAAARLPIGTSGQILKVSSSGIPEWGAAPASGVSSVNTKTGAVTLNSEDVGAMVAAYSFETFSFNGVEMELPARRNTRWTINFSVSGSTRTLFLPSTGVQNGDRIHVSLTAPNNTTVVIKRPQPGAAITIATIEAGKRFLYAASVTNIVGGVPSWTATGELTGILGAVPSSSNSTGTVGSFSFVDNFLYVCIAPDVWRRVPISAW